MGLGQVFVTEIKLRATHIYTLAFTSLLLEELEGAGDFQHMFVHHVCAEVQLMLNEMKLAQCISPNTMLSTYQRNSPAWWLCCLLHQTLLGNPSSAQWQNWSPVSEVIMEREGKKRDSWRLLQCFHVKAITSHPETITRTRKPPLYHNIS